MYLMFGVDFDGEKMDVVFLTLASGCAQPVRTRASTTTKERFIMIQRA